MKINYYSATQEEISGIFESIIEVLGMLQEASDVDTEKAKLIYSLYLINSIAAEKGVPEEVFEPIRSILTGDTTLEESGEMLVKSIHAIHQYMGEMQNPDNSERKE